MELFSSGEFPLLSLREGVRHVRFRLMSDVDADLVIVGCGEAMAMATKQKSSQAITKKELAYLLSRLCIVDATTMQVRRVVNGQVVPPFSEGSTLP